MSKGLKEVIKKLIIQRDAIKDKTAPLHEERNALIEKIRPDEDRARELAKEIRAEEQPALSDVQVQLNALCKVLRIDPHTVTLADLEDKAPAPEAESDAASE